MILGRTISRRLFLGRNTTLSILHDIQRLRGTAPRRKVVRVVLTDRDSKQDFA